MTDGTDDERLMREAIAEARTARDSDEVPVGAVVVHARIGRLVYGAPEPKTGAVRSAMQALDAPFLNHRVEVVYGVLEQECRELIRAFFVQRRSG